MECDAFSSAGAHAASRPADAEEEEGVVGRQGRAGARRAGRRRGSMEGPGQSPCIPRRSAHEPARPDLTASGVVPCLSTGDDIAAPQRDQGAAAWGPGRMALGADGSGLLETPASSAVCEVGHGRASGPGGAGDSPYGQGEGSEGRGGQDHTGEGTPRWTRHNSDGGVSVRVVVERGEVEPPDAGHPESALALVALPGGLLAEAEGALSPSHKPKQKSVRRKKGEPLPIRLVSTLQKEGLRGTTESSFLSRSCNTPAVPLFGDTSCENRLLVSRGGGYKSCSARQKEAWMSSR